MVHANVSIFSGFLLSFPSNLFFSFFFLDIAPVFGRLSVQHEDVQFLKVDVDECKEIRSFCGVSAMPTFQFYRAGEKIDEFCGADASKLTTLVGRHSK